MARNEQTSPRVAKIAAKVLAMQNDLNLELYEHPHGQGPVITSLKWRDIRALAASCLTQAADKPKMVRALLPAAVGKTEHMVDVVNDALRKPKRAAAKRSPAK